MARKDDSPAISLFSFQDIITSLTGIMFLIVLLLILCLNTMRKKEGPDSAAVQNSKRFNQLNEEILRMKKEELSYRKRIDELKKLQLDTLWIKIEQQNRMLNKIKKDHSKIQQQIELAILKAKKLKEENVSLTLNLKKKEKENIRIAKQIEDLKEKISKKHKQTKNIKTALKYTFDNALAASPVLVECTATGIRILECVSGNAIDLRIENAAEPERKQKFLEWIKTRTTKEYYTLLIKPESFEYESLVYDLHKLGKSRGVEFLPDNDITLFGEN